MTSVARTLLDLAATVRPHQLERALAQAERLELYDHAAITDVLARANGHRGQRALAEATAQEPKWTRSDFEARLLRIVRAAGLPEPRVNITLTALDHPHPEVDLYWPAHRLIVETDGWATHRTRQAFERDRARDAAITAAGHRVVRFTWRTPDTTIERRLRALLHD
jgi:very-short-patch-repair endonuclease